MGDGGRLGVFVVLMWAAIGGMAMAMRAERFGERLAVRPLADGSVLGRFEFESEQGQGGRHQHGRFPKAMQQMVRGLNLWELELAFTQGRWEHRKWGAAEGAEVKPGGVELRASFRPGEPNADALWRNVTHTLSGLFCASVNFLEDASMVAKSGDVVTGSVRRGALPREAVCTENLTPWLKLLPCRDRAGLSTLLSRARIHKGAYYSLQVHVTTEGETLRLLQTLIVVLNPRDASQRDFENARLNWSLSSLFGHSLIGSCPIATSSELHLELDPNLVADFKKSNQSAVVDMNSSEVFSIDLSPDDVSTRLEPSGASLLLHYDVGRSSEAHPLDVGMSWRAFRPWAPRQGPFRGTQFLTGRGTGRDAIVSLVNANRDNAQWWMDESRTTDVTLFQIVPWYLRLYMHTLKVVVDGDCVPLHSGVRLKLSPAEDRKSPAVVEIGVTIPRNATTVVISVEFDKGYLRIDEHPPDANRGFDLPAALFTFASSSERGSEKKPFQVYSENLLVLLATPDFSMPYNVITFTMTALALYFGSLLNSLRLRSVTEVEVQQPPSRVSTKLKNLLARLRGREKVKTL